MLQCCSLLLAMALISALQLFSFFGAAFTGKNFGTALMLEPLTSSESLPLLFLAAALAAARAAALAASLC